MGMSGAAYADYVWNGSTDTITTDSWNTAANWEVTDSSTALTDGKGPGVTGSNAWHTIWVSNASGSIGSLEGWNLGMNLTAANLTVESISKIQNDSNWSTAKIALNQSSLTLNIATGHQHAMNVTLNGASTLNLNLSKDRTDGATVIDFGNFSAEEHGVVTFGRKQGATGNYASDLTLNGTLTNTVNAESTTLHEVTLGTVGEGISLRQFNSRIAAEQFLLADGPLTASEENVGYYSVANDNGTLKLYYVTGDMTYYTWDGGNGSWADANWNSGSSIEGKSRVVVNSGTVAIAAGTEASTQALFVNGGTVDVTGTLQTELISVSGSGKLKWGSDESSSNAISVSKISVDGADAQFSIAHQHVDMSATTDVELKNGGKLYSDDTDFAANNATDERRVNQIAFKNLNVTENGGVIQYNWGGSFSFETMTGDGNLSIANGSETSWTIVKSLDDYTGTISGSANNHVLKLGSVNLSSGKTATINTRFGAIGETVTKTGAGTLILQGNGVDAATLDIRGGTVRWGSTGNVDAAEQNTATLGFNKVIIGSGATLEDSHFGGNTSVFDIEMQGGTLYAYAQRQNNGVGVQYGTLTLKAGTANSMNQTWKSCRNFAVLTGGEANGNVAGTSLTVGGAYEDNMKDNIGSVTNFNGTLTGSSYNNDGKKLTIGAAAQETGYNAVINAQVTLGESFTKTGAGSMTFGSSTMLSGDATIEQGSVIMTSNDLKFNGHTMTLEGIGNASLTHDGVTYTAISAAKDGTITRTGNGSLGLYNDGAATTLSNVTLTTSQDKGYSVTMDNVSLVSNANKSIWLSGDTTKDLVDVTTGGTLHIGEGTHCDDDAAVVSISGTATVNSVQTGVNATLEVSGTVNAAADSTITSLTLSGGSISVKPDHTGTLNVTSLFVTADGSEINANLVVNGGTIGFADHTVLTMGCSVTVGTEDTTTVLLTQEMVDTVAATGRYDLFVSVEQALLGPNIVFARADGAELEQADVYSLKYDGSKIYITPEPATATLSLLALAALAARRKRR